MNAKYGNFNILTAINRMPLGKLVNYTGFFSVKFADCKFSRSLKDREAVAPNQVLAPLENKYAAIMAVTMSRLFESLLQFCRSSYPRPFPNVLNDGNVGVT